MMLSISFVINSEIQSVDQDNAFILSTGSNLSLLENKLINFLLSCIRVDDTHFRTILVTYDAIYRIFDYDPRKGGRQDRIDKVVLSLKGKMIHFTPASGSPYYCGTIPWFEICEKAGIYVTANYQKSSYRSVSSIVFTVLNKNSKKRAQNDVPLPDVAFCIMNSIDGSEEKCCIVNVSGSLRQYRKDGFNSDVQDGILA